MRLIESDPSLNEMCRTVERSMEPIAELSDVALGVIKYDNFDNIPGIIAPYRKQCLLYKESKILINFSLFQCLSSLAQQSAIAHEVAHDVIRRNPNKMTNYQDLHEDILADYITCTWGFIVGLRELRRLSNGEEYIEALDKWENEGEYLRVMRIWYLKKLAGLEKY